MARSLLVLRHAKSDWAAAHGQDIDRVLAERGVHDADNMGRYMQQQGLLPDHVLCSSATRTRQTLELLNLSVAAEQIHIELQLYLAGLSCLLSRLAAVPKDKNCVLLIGHNPGMDELVGYLSSTPPPLTASHKLMSTCALAQFTMPADWQGSLQQRAQLHSLTRPADLNKLI